MAHLKRILLLFSISIATSACTNLDLSPLSQGSSENWYTDQAEIDMALNDLYRDMFWPIDDDDWTDDWTRRNELSEITSGTINGEWGTLNTYWSNAYKAISRANTLLVNLEQSDIGLSEQLLNQFMGEARYVRACQYANLAARFGDVIYVTHEPALDEAFTMSRTSKDIVMQRVYEDFDFAIANLPATYGDSQLRRATKGAAMSMKSRFALYNGDWAIARDAAKACMDLDVYDLYPDFGELFLSKTKNTKEAIFSIPRSNQLGVNTGNSITWYTITRNAGGLSWLNPSWELFCSYLCTDGLPIDESPLFNPRRPFDNRDPRCAETIVEFQTNHLGFMYQPHPDSLQVLNFNTGRYQINNDNRVNAQYASFNGLVWKKGVDEDWSDDRLTDPDKFIIRYADVLLMYAEAKIELNEIDPSVLEAINRVRARAYQAAISETSAYPAVSTVNQAALRRIVRTERRMEFAWEGLRYMDIIRWRLAEKVLNRDVYGLLDPEELRSKIVTPGLWFFPSTPIIDEDGAVDFSPMYNGGLIKQLAIRNFDPSRQYLWPIPSKEILINSNLTQNPGY